MDHAILLVTSAVVVAAAVVDILFKKIPNLITLPAIFLGLTLNSFQNGWEGFFSSLVGALVGMLFLFPFYLLGGMGAGDVKLLSAVGALLGHGRIFDVVLITALIGGIMALLYILAHRAVRSTFLNILTIAKNIFLLLSGKRSLSQLRSDESLTIKNPKLIKMPYGVAIALGTLLSFLVKL